MIIDRIMSQVIILESFASVLSLAPVDSPPNIHTYLINIGIGNNPVC